MSSAHIPEETRRELSRLDRLAHAAHVRGDFVTEATCKLRWADLYRASGAVSSPKPEAKAMELAESRKKLNRHTPLWRVRQRLSPLSAIVKVEEVRYTNTRGHQGNYFIEHLACGHTRTEHEGLDYSARSTRRRCRECGTKALEAAGYAGDLDTSDSEYSVNSTLSHFSTVGKFSSSTLSLALAPVKPEPAKPAVIEMPRRDANPQRSRLARPKRQETTRAQEQSG
jgi:hypothetical protein